MQTGQRIELELAHFHWHHLTSAKSRIDIPDLPVAETRHSFER
jgi:hypothetical protein